MDLPIYFIQITDDPTDENGFEYVSIVDRPAIKMEYMKFSEVPLKYAANEKQIVTGPVIVANLPIYRELNGKAFYTVFDRENTEKLVKKWALQQKYNAVNKDHETPINSMFLFESYLINRERGINPPKEWADVPDGSWFLSYYVQDPVLWGKIQSGEFNGFSVEGLFGLSPDGEADAVRELMAEIDKFRASLAE